VCALYGTNERSDWCTNLDIVPARGARYWWHRGFLRYAEAVYDFAREFSPRFVIGHSLGGATAQILSVSMPYASCYAYGAPRVRLGGGHVEGEGRVVVLNRPDDRVTRMPRFFRHLGVVLEAPHERSPFKEDHSISRYRDGLRVHRVELSLDTATAQ